jgi:hypothetical protein
MTITSDDDDLLMPPTHLRKPASSNIEKAIADVKLLEARENDGESGVVFSRLFSSSSPAADNGIDHAAPSICSPCYDNYNDDSLSFAIKEEVEERQQLVRPLFLPAGSATDFGRLPSSHFRGGSTVDTTGDIVFGRK